MFAPVANHVIHLLNTLSKISHRWTIRESYKIDTFASSDMTDFTRIEIEENPGNTNDFMLDALFKKTETGNKEVSHEEENMSFVSIN